jgi:hypothetical protein
MFTLEELGPDSCRWPVTENCDEDEWSTFVFCGNAVARKGCPYCAEHMARAYMKSYRVKRIVEWDWRRKSVELAAASATPTPRPQRSLRRRGRSARGWPGA